MESRSERSWVSFWSHPLGTEITETPNRPRLTLVVVHDLDLGMPQISHHIWDTISFLCFKTSVQTRTTLSYQKLAVDESMLEP